MSCSSSGSRAGPCCSSTLDELSDEDLRRTVTIRALDLSVRDALLRALAHVSYHVGQIVYAAKAARGDTWTYLSIAPGQSEQYNRNPILDKERWG